MHSSRAIVFQASLNTWRQDEAIQFADALNKCIEHELTISASACRLKDDELQIEHMLPIMKR